MGSRREIPFKLSCKKLSIMTLHFLLLLPLIARCMGQENPCEGISLGACEVEPGSILANYSVTPDMCSMLCKMDNNCEFWIAQWDGTFCQHLSTGYQHDCESFAGPITCRDWTEGQDSCNAYVENDCFYTGDRAEEDEPPAGNVESIEACQQWAEAFSMVDEVAFFHFDSVTEECRLYRTMEADCQSVGGPRTAPSFEQCMATTTTTTDVITCPDGWTQADTSCYLLSIDVIPNVHDAIKFCEDLGSTLVEVNTEAENTLLVGMAGEAAAIDNNTHRDFWMGGLRTNEGWQWMSGNPMEYTNWRADVDPDVSKGVYTSLLRNDFPTYYWNPDEEDGGKDNGVICEIISV